MYDIWSILGIEPTTNKKVIQQAYAYKLKIYHPEDDPVGVQHLRDAYRSAIAYVKNQSTQGQTVQSPKRALTERIFSKSPMEEKESKKKEYVVENEPDLSRDNDEREAIPEYISQMGNADVFLLHENEMSHFTYSNVY